MLIEIGYFLFPIEVIQLKMIGAAAFTISPLASIKLIDAATSHVENVGLGLERPYVKNTLIDMHQSPCNKALDKLLSVTLELTCSSCCFMFSMSCSSGLY